MHEIDLRVRQKIKKMRNKADGMVNKEQKKNMNSLF